MSAPSLYPWQSQDWTCLNGLKARLPGAILLKGARGIGKLVLAQAFAHSLLCNRNTAEGHACGQCSACHWLEQGSHPDLKFIQPESMDPAAEESGKKPSKQIAVEQIRALSDFLGMTAHQGGRKVALIYPAERMNVNAANALLKSLEEPPEGMLFLLVTSKPQHLLPTILSRCLSITASQPGRDECLSWLRAQGMENPQQALAAAGYSPLLALQQDQLADMPERQALLNGLRDPARLDALALAETLQKVEQAHVVEWMQHWHYDLVALKLSGMAPRYHPGELGTLQRLCHSVSSLDLARFQTRLHQARRESQHTLNPKLFLESLLIGYRQLLAR